jgi:hypothetical protein
VEDQYEGVVLPDEPLPGGTQYCMKARGEDPVGRIAADLEALCGRRSEVRTLCWPLYLRMSRV